MPTMIRILAITLFLSAIANPASAYVGPGAGLGLLMAFWALVTAVVSSLAFLVIWPLRHRLRRRKGAGKAGQHHPPDEEGRNIHPH